MATPLTSFRQQYPQYDKYSDQQLADALYEKFYAGKIEKSDYLTQLGLVAEAPIDQPVVAAAKPQGPPISEETRAQLTTLYNAATPEEREAMKGRTDYIGQFTQFLDAQYKAQDEEVKKQVPIIQRQSELVDPRREYRRKEAMRQGAAPETAENIAAQAAIANLPPEEPIAQVTPSQFDFDLSAEYKNAPTPIRGVAKGYYGYKQGVLGINQAIGDLLGAEEFAATQAKGAEEAAGATTAIGESANTAARQFENAVSSFAQNVPTILAGVVSGGATIPLSVLGVMSFGQEYATGREKGLSGSDAAMRAGLFASAEIFGEVAGLPKFMRGISGSLINKSFQEATDIVSEYILKQIPGEQLTTTLQFLADKYPSFALNPKAGLKEYLSQSADTLVQTVMQGGLMLGGVKAAQFATTGQLRDTVQQPFQPAAPVEPEKPVERVEPTIGAEPTITPEREEPTIPAAPTETVAVAPPATDATTIEELLASEGPTRPSVLAPEEINYGQLNQELLEEGALTEEQIAEAEDEEINRRLREASVEEDEAFFDEGTIQEAGIAEPKLVQRGKKMVTPLESAKMTLTNAKRAFGDYEARVRGALAETGMTIDQLPETTRVVLEGLNKKVRDAQAVYDDLLGQEIEAAAVIEPGLTLEQLKAEQNALRTKAGKPPAQKSPARSRFDALQQQIDVLEKPAEETVAEEPPVVEAVVDTKTAQEAYDQTAEAAAVAKQKAKAAEDKFQKLSNTLPAGDPKIAKAQKAAETARQKQAEAEQAFTTAETAYKQTKKKPAVSELEEAKAKVGEELSKLASSIGAKNNLTPEEEGSIQNFLAALGELMRQLVKSGAKTFAQALPLAKQKAQEQLKELAKYIPDSAYQQAFDTATTKTKKQKIRPAKAPKVYQNLGRTLNRFKNTPQGAVKAVTRLIDMMANRPNIVFWSKVMPLLPDWAVRSLLPRQLVKDGDKFQLKSILPQLDAYDRALADFERTQKELEGEIVKIVQMGSALPIKTHEALSALQLEATSREIDPDTNTKDAYLNQLWANLQKMKDGDKAIEIYRRQRDFYKAIYNKIRTNAAKNLYKALVRKLKDPAEAARRTKEILDRDMPQRKDPYFPMARFGEFWIGFKMMNDEGKLEKGFLMFESGLARDKALADIESAIREEIKQANPGMSDKDVDDVMVNEGRLQARDGFSNLLNFVYGQENALSKARDIIGESIEEMIAGLQKSGAATVTTAQAEKLLRSAKDDATGTIQQLLIQLAPMGSLKRLFAKRKNIAGAVADSNRSFAVTATKQMNYLAKIMHGGQMEAALVAANEGLQYLSPRNQIFAGMVISEFELRMESNLSPKPQSAVIQFLSGSAFVTQMTTVASAIRNLMYIFWNGFSVLGSRLGIARTSALMSKYLVGFGRGFYAKDRPDGIFGVGFPSLIHNKKLNKFVRYGLERAVAENKLNISQAYDLAEVRSTPTGIPLLSWRGIWDSPRRIVNMLAVVLHNSERIGREALWATALEGRARQLFAEKKPDGTRKYTDDEISELAYQFADEYAGERGAGTFGYQRRGRLFKEGLTNLILKYKSAPIQVVFQMFEAHNKLAWHRYRRFIREEKKRIEADPQLGPEAVKEFEQLIKQERYAAAKYLVLLNAIAFTFMGLEGTPYWWLLSRIAGFFLRQNDPNEDNPEAIDFDLDLFLENYTEEQIGTPWSQMLMRGPISTATNVSLVDQMSLNPPSMFLQGWSDTANKSGETALQKATMFMLGPVFGGLPTTAARAYDAGQRDTMRGIEMLLPGGIRTPVAAARVAKEGYTTTKGEVILPKEKVTGYDLFLTGLGFSPEDYRRYQESKFKVNTIEAKVNMQKQDVYNDRWLVEQMPPGEQKSEELARVLKRRDDFNKAYPSLAISDKDMADSITKRRKRQQAEQAHSGFTADEKMWPIFEDRTKFGRMDR